MNKKQIMNGFLRITIISIIGLFFINGIQGNTPDQPKVRVLIAYTAKAQAWADLNNINCTNLLQKSRAEIDAVRSLTGIKHVCEENQGLGNNETPIRNLANIVLAETNQIYANSGASNASLELADVFPVGDLAENNISEGKHAEPFLSFIAEELKVAAALMRLRNRRNTGTSQHALLEALHERRLSTQADIVVLLTDPDIDNLEEGHVLAIGGLAAGIGVRNPENGFTVLPVDTAPAPAYVFAHEVSHLFGANHYEIRKQLLVGPMDIIAEEPYYTNENKIDAWGFRKNEKGTPVPYETLMSYGVCEGCIRVPLLSTVNPGPGVTPLTYGGIDAKGITRNNARTVSLHSEVLAGFAERLTATLPEPEGIVKYGVDFGYNYTSGYDTDLQSRFIIKSVNYKTYDSDCETTSGAGCDDYWNNLTNRKASGDELHLRNQQADDSEEIFLKITKSFHGYTKVDNMLAGLLAYGFNEMPTMAMTDGFTVVRLYSTPTFELQGLDPNSSYAFKFFSSKSPVDSRRVVKFELNGRDSVQTEIRSHGNFLRFANIRGVRPDAEGTLQIKVIADMFSVPFFNSVSLNAMEFYREP